jgi:hypothetical protein
MITLERATELPAGTRRLLNCPTTYELKFMFPNTRPHIPYGKFQKQALRPGCISGISSMLAVNIETAADGTFFQPALHLFEL